MLELLKNLKLNLGQWLLVSLAAVVGVLVTALKIQGSRLHYYKIQLLEQHFDGIDKADDAAVSVARKRYEQSLKEYNSK